MDVAPDGSPVAFYARLPATGEPELIHALAPPGATILDIGCGVGRMAGPLAALGHRVTGIDNAPGMLDALPDDIEGVLAEATTVRLGRRFDVVLMASHLVDDPADGPAFARTAAAHVAAAGVVIGEAYPEGWDPEAAVGRTSRLGDAEFTLVRARRDGDLVDAEMRYVVDGVEWRQPFVARILDEPALRQLLADAGLAFERWLDRPGWFIARPARQDAPQGPDPTAA